MADYRYVAYLDARVYGQDSGEIDHLLFGGWVRVEGAAKNGKLPVCAGYGRLDV